MKRNGFVKRAFFFLTAFAVGLSIVALTVGFKSPLSSRQKCREWKRAKFHEMKAERAFLAAELERARCENLQLRKRLGEKVDADCGIGSGSGSGLAGESFDGTAVHAVPPPPLPPLPVAPHNHR